MWSGREASSLHDGTVRWGSPAHSWNLRVQPGRGAKVG